MIRKFETALKQAIKRKIASRNNYRFAGLPPVRVRASQGVGAPRLNLVIMSIRKGAVFGGADTALRLLTALSGRFAHLRLIVQSEDGTEFSPTDWPDWTIDTENTAAPKSIGFMGQRDYTPEIHDNDYFLATNWMSTYFVRAARAVQSTAGPARFIYMIQDFEPGFYAWSGRHMLASATYVRKDDVIAVFNTQLLHDYFRQLGIAFQPSFVFEPRLSPSLAKYLPRLPSRQKKRLMLVYGRPLSERNAFDMTVGSLQAWAETYPSADRWQLVSLGETHKTVELGRGVRLRSYGKVSLDTYAGYLLDAAVGFSLMVSPHPSYPPLEMAQFGARVVTNTYVNKDLSQRVANIVSVAETTPEMFAKAVTQACDAFKEGSAAQEARAFLGGSDEFPFIDALYDTFTQKRGSPG